MTEPQIQAWLDQEDTLVAQMIREYGQFIQLVAGEPGDVPPDFAYTVGLFGLGHPELVVLSLGGHTAMGVLNSLGARVRGGANLVPGELLTFDEWPHRIVVEEIPNPGEILFAANRHYKRPDSESVPAFQLTYDDMWGRFPWDDGYANRPELQPRPGTWTA